MFYTFCIVCPEKNHRASESGRYGICHQLQVLFLQKKTELSFGEGDLQLRNLLKLSVKKYEKMLDSLHVKKYEKT